MVGNVLLSVIIPAYNAESYLKRCVDSVETSLKYITTMPLRVEAQSVTQSERNAHCELERDSEVILVDDGSTDSTGEVAKKLAAMYGNLRILTLTDEGVSVARNRGMELARGKYISFVDADDVVVPDCFQKLIAAAEENNADIAGCEFFRWTDESELHQAITQNAEKTEEQSAVTSVVQRIETKVYTPHQYISEEFLNENTRCWSKIYRMRDCEDEQSGMDMHDSTATQSTVTASNVAASRLSFTPGLTIGEDMLFVIQAVKKSCKVVELKNYQGYGYYINPKGAINRPFTPQYMDQIGCWELVKEEVCQSINQPSDDGYGLTKKDITNLNTKTLMAIMLVASKIATTPSYNTPQSVTNHPRVMDDGNFTTYIGEDYISTCRMKLKRIIKSDHRSFMKLDIGYKVKVSIFLLSQKFYVKLYGKYKNKANN